MIYKDINVLTTPLLYYIGLIFFLIMGANYFVFRLYNFIIIISLYISIYILFKKVNINKIYSAIYTIIMFLVSCSVIGYGANYNVLALVFSIIGIILNVEKYVNKRKIKYYNSIQGILIFLICFTKQNIGLYYFVVSLLIETVMSKKRCIKNIIKQLSITLIPSIMYLCYLYINNSLYNFIDYTILGMQEFVVENKFVHDNFFVLYLIILIYIVIVIQNNKKQGNNLAIFKIFTIYSVVYLLIAFPILEKFHSIIAGIPLIILFIYCIHISFINHLEIKKKFLKKIITITVIFLIARTVYIEWSRNELKIDNKESIYYGAVYLEIEQELIQKIGEYMEKSKEKVIILSAEAGIVNMEYEIDNGILDLPTHGNIGKKGAEKIINILSKLEGTKILMTSEKVYWQEYDEVRKYVEENFEKIDEIEGKAFKYNVYYIN